MRKLVLILSAAAAVGFALPVVTSAHAEDKVVIKSGGDHPRHWNRGHRKVVVVKERRHEGWRRHHAEGSKKIIIRHRDRD
jgi:hypothetical protein